MKGAASKPVSRSLERPRAISLTSSGTKSSKYSSPLPTHSQLTKVKSKSSDDLSSKAAGSLTSSSSRLKKTVTMGTIAELTENKAKSSPGTRSRGRQRSDLSRCEAKTLSQ
uniref:cytospin-B-like n=1 Tax=Pristiophorus japonicus TaxID=55135 RepID=UPI00398F3C5B